MLYSTIKLISIVFWIIVLLYVIAFQNTLVFMDYAFY